jgi:hypothetical protein
LMKGDLHRSDRNMHFVVSVSGIFVLLSSLI